MATIPNALSVLSTVATQYLASQAQAHNGTQGAPRAAAAGPANLCDSCHAKPKYFDGTKTHAYCGKRCAAKIKGAANGNGGGNVNITRKPTTKAPGNGAARGGMCDSCHKKPKYSDGKTTHQFCGKSCAQRAKAQGAAGPAPVAGPGPNAANRNGGGGGACLMCGKASKKGGVFCGKSCADNAERRGPTILEVPASHPSFASVAGQFKSSWRHKTACPAVKRVYKVITPQASLTRYDAYRASVESRGNFAASGRTAGNENRRWHGTTRECTLGDNGNSTLCGSATCSLCSIISTSYCLKLFGKKTGWGRFGAGIYTSSTSSKSNDYSNNTQPSNCKTILLNKVVVGKGYKMTQDNTKLTAPPAGYDSVLAEVRLGGTLNYDELICYNEDAIRPSYLVVYDA